MQKEKASLTVVVIYVWRSKAYIPVQDQYESGIFVGTEPIYIAELKNNDLFNAVNAVKEKGHKHIPDLKSREEVLKRKDPVLAATKTKSWKQLARNGASYTIGWTEKEIRIDMSRLNNRGVWENDLQKIKKLSPNTSLKNIVKIILEDKKTRPEVLQ
jgi:hypothetical protein